MVEAVPVPDDAFLAAYTRAGAFTDCYRTTVSGRVSLAEMIEAFYTTPLFGIERWLLARALGFSSSDAQARSLANGEIADFAAWRVEHRDANQILLAAGRTRSWLGVEPTDETQGSTTLRFGSAVVPVSSTGKLGFAFDALLGFHRLYSRSLLAACAKRVQTLRSEGGIGQAP
jgi:hypothetical protein